MDTVSIPHRYGKNKMGAWHAHTPTEVSIPHRYGKNEVKDGYLYVIDGFPFLIGTVRTIGYVENQNQGSYSFHSS